MGPRGITPKEVCGVTLSAHFGTCLKVVLNVLHDWLIKIDLKKIFEVKGSQSSSQKLCVNVYKSQMVKKSHWYIFY